MAHGQRILTVKNPGRSAALLLSAFFIIASAHMAGSSKAAAEELSPREKGEELAQRLCAKCHAMGYDAYHLVGNLYGDRDRPMGEIIGATGNLYLEPDGRIHRKLAWARFERGQPVPLPGNDEYEFLFDLPGPASRL